MVHATATKKGGAHDQYYTSQTTLDRVVSLVKKHIPQAASYRWIDFSAGDDAFRRTLGIPSQAFSSFDIDPKAKTVSKKDWFDVRRTHVKKSPNQTKGFIVALNPPYGSRASLARKFIRHAISEFGPAYFVLISPYQSWRDVLDRYDIVHVDTGKSNKFYTIQEGKMKLFSYRTPFVILRKRKTAKVVEKYHSKHVHVTLRHLHSRTLQQFDMINASSGDGSIGQHIFLRKGSTWWYYHRGVFKNRFDHPRDSHLKVGNNFSGTIFEPSVTWLQRVKIAKNFHKNLPLVAFLSSPAHITIPEIHRIIDKILDGPSIIEVTEECMP